MSSSVASPLVSEPPRSVRFALASVATALLAIAGGVAGAHFAFLPPYAGFALSALGLALGAGPTPILGVVGLVQTRGGGVGRQRAILATALGVVLLFVFLDLAVPVVGVPPIHDVTTDPADPPVFRELAKVAAAQGRDLAYPQGGPEVSARQQAAYPDLAPMILPIEPAAAFDAARLAAADLGWSVVWANVDQGLIEATATSDLFRFVDDIAVRVRRAPEGSVVDVRSTSRVGHSDLGANAARIRAFAKKLRKEAEG